MEIALLAVIAIEGAILAFGLKALTELVEKLKIAEKHDPQEMQGYFAAFAAATKVVPAAAPTPAPPPTPAPQQRRIVHHHDLAPHEAINK